MFALAIFFALHKCLRKMMYRSEGEAETGRNAAEPRGCAFEPSPSSVGRGGIRLEMEWPPPMIGMVLVSHGHLADEFRAALEHVVGPQRQLQSISIGPDDDMEQRRQEIIDAVTKVDSGSGVVLLTDMFGGTPSNLAISVMTEGRVEVVAGANLPMLIKLASVRESASLSQAVAQAQDAGRKYIYVASRILNGK
jgi:mannose PTS system EIIA component